MGVCTPHIDCGTNLANNLETIQEQRMANSVWLSLTVCLQSLPNSTNSKPPGRFEKHKEVESTYRAYRRRCGSPCFPFCPEDEPPHLLILVQTTAQGGAPHSPLMPGFSENSDPISPWKKRKRDHEDPSLSRTYDHPRLDPILETIRTNHCSHINRASYTPFQMNCSDRENNLTLAPRHQPESDISFRPRCLPRKRRHVHPSYLALPPQQPSLLSPNAYAPKQDPYSPPVSPKTLVPIQCPSTSQLALRPCHICHRRPTTRHVLDAYADCNLCGERACYICLRQCDSLTCPGSVHVDLGTPGETDLYSPNEDFDPEHPRIRRKICSRCAVEGISDSGVEIVRCMDCVQGHATAPWPPGHVTSQWALDETNHDYMHG